MLAISMSCSCCRAIYQNVKTPTEVGVSYSYLVYNNMIWMKKTRHTIMADFDVLKNVLFIHFKSNFNQNVDCFFFF